MKQTTRTGTESQKWRSYAGYQQRGGREGMGGKVQGISSINGRYKIDKGMLRIVWELRSQRTYMYDPWT